MKPPLNPPVDGVKRVVPPPFSPSEESNAYNTPVPR